MSPVVNLGDNSQRGRCGWLVWQCFLLAQVVKSVPVGVAYAIWSGAGTAAIVAIGAMFLGEPLSVAKIIGIGLIVAGVVVLNVGGATH